MKVRTLLNSIKENQDSQERKIEKMNSRVNEVYYGDINELEEEELLMSPILNWSSDVEVDSCDLDNSELNIKSQTSVMKMLMRN